MHRLQRAAFALLAMGTSVGVYASCGAAFCSVNTSWDLPGSVAQPGGRVDLRYEYIDQDQPRSGGNKVGVGQIPRHHDEVRTLNRNWLGTFDYTFNADWGMSVAATLVDRFHQHIHNHRGAKILDTWDFNGLGDTRVVGRYRLSAVESRESGGSAGLQFGLKLPTGDFRVRNGNGEPAERTLQPGTGTTDAILGAYLVRSLPLKDLSWFTQAQLQAPINARDGYKPGERVAIDAGLRYDLGRRVSLLLQANVLYRGKDAGSNAEPADSGGAALFVSPGVSVDLTRDVRVYAFLQAPLYQHVNGVQLTASKSALAGLSARF